MSEAIKTALWIRADGIQERLSEGLPSLLSLDTTALHVMGWIEVEHRGSLTHVRLDPYAVRYDALMRLPGVLATRFRGRAVEVDLSRHGSLLGAPISFLSNDSAIEYLHKQVIAERGDLDAEPPIDRLAKGMASGGTSIERAARPAAVGPMKGRRVDIKDIQTNMEEDALARPLSELERALQTAERVARRLIGASWLRGSAPVVDNLSAELYRDDSDTVLYALHTLGWIGVEMEFPMRDKDIRAVLPARIVLDPHAIEEHTLQGLSRFCHDWSDAQGVITLVWWDGVSWVSESGTAEQIADRTEHLVASKRHAFFPSTIQSVAMEPDQMGQEIEGEHRSMIARTVRIWGGRSGNDGGGGLFGELERGGFFRGRTKLVRLDENFEFRIAQYQAGGLTLWDEKEGMGLVGRRLTDVPDKRLGQRVQQDLLSVTRRGQPLVHKCYGTLTTNAGPKMFNWTRLSLPVFSPRKTEADAVLSLCLL